LEIKTNVGANSSSVDRKDPQCCSHGCVVDGHPSTLEDALSSRGHPTVQRRS